VQRDFPEVLALYLNRGQKRLMARVFPSDVVSLIEHQFPWVIRGNSPSGASCANGASLAGLTDVVEQIPDSLLALSSEQGRDFLFAISSLRHLDNKGTRQMDVEICAKENANERKRLIF
jgi:hypothetical protein